MSRALVNRQRVKGYSVGPDVLDEGDFTGLETTASPSTMTTVGYVDVEEDEFYRPGQGQYQGPEYTRGRLYATLKNGSGTEPADSTKVEVVKLSSQNNVQSTIWRGKYGQVKQGANTRSQRVPFSEEGNPIVTDPSRIGLRLQSGSGSSFTVDFASSSIEIDAVRGEQ